MKNINICIVHYNTPRLTECLVRSINKFTPNSTIYIFDNSDKLPFTYRQNNIVYIDNTKGQIINFDTWLDGIKTKVSLSNKHASAKHCYTIEKCMEIIGENFILLDSDVLLKKDISELFDERYIYVGGVEAWRGNNRVIPYCCFINTKLCKEKKINYYNEKYIVGLTNGCKYDTGAYFWMKCKDFPHKAINFEDYVVHLDDGSQKFEKESRYEAWLTRYEKLWKETNKMTVNYESQLKAFLKKRKLSYNIDNPVTIQEKIQWLKIHDSIPLKTKCADKVLVHEYCKEKLGEDICIPILKIYDKVSEINWDELPDQFVIKCNHGSGMNIIVKNKAKLNIADAEMKLNKWLNTDFAFYCGYELHYHDIPRKIFVEKYMSEPGQEESLYDYKFWCFNGEPKFYTINDGHGHGKWMYFYDMNGNLMPCRRTDFSGEPTKQLPQFSKLDVMAEYAKKLSKDFKFVRVDFYIINGTVYLGELTFTPGSGLFKYNDPKYSEIFGNMLNLNVQEKTKPSVSHSPLTGIKDADFREKINERKRRIAAKNIVSVSPSMKRKLISVQLKRFING